MILEQFRISSIEKVLNLSLSSKILISPSLLSPSNWEQ